MATYNFSSISAEQALAIGGGDTLLLDLAPLNRTTVLFLSGAAGDQISVEAAGRTVTFGTGLTDAIKSGPGGSILIVGKSGNDGPFFGTGGDDALYGGAGDDNLSGGAGNDLLQGNQGRDTLTGQTGADVIYGGQDDDLISPGEGGGPNFAQGNKGNDTITGGGAESDTLLGGQGDDLIGALSRGPAGPFNIYLQPVIAGGRGPGGNDFLNGNLGDDIIFTGVGSARVFGEGGNDGLFALSGSGNLLDGGEGNDTLYAQNGSATLNGGDGNDIVAYQSGTFVLNLGDGDDSCAAIVERSTDRLTIDGGAGNDIINGSNGSDTITGGLGSDTIDGYAGADTVAGGGGSDQFQFFASEAFTAFETLDLIVDWGADDRLFFARDDVDEPVGMGTLANYAEATADSYAAALTFANGRIAAGVINYMAVQVGADVFVFADSRFDNGVADSAVRLVGRTLADIAFGNFDAVTS